MSRYRNGFDDEFDGQSRRSRFERERPWNYSQSLEERGRALDDYNRSGLGRHGERADYQYDEPRYNDYPGRYREDMNRRPYEGRDYGQSSSYNDRVMRSRLRVRDIMTRDLAVAYRDTILRDVATMMRDEDTGIIPVIDFPSEGNGRSTTNERRLNGGYGHGKLIGLITDRDIVMRAVADGKDCATTRAEEVMSNDLHSARPHERVVEVIRKMGDKQVRRIPVVNENGKLLGMVSMGDIAVETQADTELAGALEDISRESTFWGKIFG